MDNDLKKIQELIFSNCEKSKKLGITILLSTRDDPVTDYISLFNISSTSGKEFYQFEIILYPRNWPNLQTEHSIYYEEVDNLLIIRSNVEKRRYSLCHTMSRRLDFKNMKVMDSIYLETHCRALIKKYLTMVF